MERLVAGYSGRDQTGRLDEQGVLEFRDVSIHFPLDLELQHPFGATWRRGIEPLGPGEHVEIVAELETGITISGIVVDENGEPVSKAVVTAIAAPGDDNSIASGGSCVSDTTGAFRLEYMARQDWLLEARRADFARATQEAVARSAGDVSGVVLRIERGSTIEGTVEWPDGTPATWSTIRATDGRASHSTSSTDGTFRFILSPGSYDLEAAANRAGLVGAVRVEDVSTGADPLALVLEEAPVFDLTGSVVDAEGTPVPWFTVRWHGAGIRSGGRQEPIKRGTFVLKALPAGELTIVVEADDYVSSEQRVVVGPGRSDALRFVLARAGTVRGTVVDARGDPVRGANVSTEGRGPETTTDEQGRFELRPAATRTCLRATKSGHAASASVEIDVASDSLLDGVVLRLGEPGRIVGRVFDPDGRGLPRVRVTAFRDVESPTSRGLELPSFVTSDAEGRFTFEALSSGPVWLSAESSDDDPAYAQAEAHVTSGRTVEVELRFQQLTSVRIRGRVRRSGQSIACAVYLRSGEAVASSYCGPDGRLDVLLPIHGTWKGIVGVESDETGAWDLRLFTLEVPEQGRKDVALDFDTLPRGSAEDLEK
jgi:hypothetical protein